MNIRLFLPISFLVLLSSLMGCSTGHLASKVSDEKFDGFKEESFLRYTGDRLKRIEDKRYSHLSLCYQGDIEEGLAALKDELEDQKKNPDYWNQVGMCYFLQKNYPKAEFYFNLSLDQKSNRYFAPAINNLGILKLKDRHYEEAIELFKKAKGRNHKVPLFNLSQVYLEFNLIDKALVVLEDLRREIKTDPDLLFSLASGYLMKGNTKKAANYLGQIPSQFRKREDVSLINAITLYEQKKYYAAKDVLNDQNFVNYYPIKKSARKLEDLVDFEIERIEKAKEEAGE